MRVRGRQPSIQRRSGGGFWLQVSPDKIDIPADRSMLRLSAAALSRRLPDPQYADGKRRKSWCGLAGGQLPLTTVWSQDLIHLFFFLTSNSTSSSPPTIFLLLKRFCT